MASAGDSLGHRVDCEGNVPLATYDSLFSPMVLRAVRSILRLSSGGMPKRNTARPMTAMTPARPVKKLVAVIVRDEIRVS